VNTAAKSNVRIGVSERRAASFWRRIKRDVDAGHRNFWTRRGERPKPVPTRTFISA
jgi:hypothetical protein